MLLVNFFRRKTDHEQRANKKQIHPATLQIKKTLKSTVVPQAEAKGSTRNNVSFPWPALEATLLIFSVSHFY